MLPTDMSEVTRMVYVTHFAFLLHIVSDIKKKIRNYFIVVKLLFHIVCYTENVHESITTGYEKPDAAC